MDGELDVEWDERYHLKNRDKLNIFCAESILCILVEHHDDVLLRAYWSLSLRAAAAAATVESTNTTGCTGSNTGGDFNRNHHNGQ
jgi:hypothetical protein